MVETAPGEVQTSKMKVNNSIQRRELTTIQGEKVTVAVPKFCTDVQFRRFAGCGEAGEKSPKSKNTGKAPNARYDGFAIS
jgi:hypothetical protein